MNTGRSSHAFTETDSDSHVQKLYAGLKARYDSLQLPYPRLLYVDKNCCTSTKQMVTQAFPSLTVRLDVFHMLWRFSKACVRTTHPGHANFMRELSQAFFKTNENDLRMLLEAIMVSFGLDDPAEAARRLRRSPSWLYRFVRRQILQPEELEERVLAVVESARNISWDGELLLPPGPEGFDRCLANQVYHIKRGCVSDPPGISLYEELGHVSFQGNKNCPLMAYRCYRGSSQLEGIHGLQASFLSGTNVGSVASQALVIDGLTRYNRNVRRKRDGITQVYPLLDNNLLIRLRASGDNMYPHLVMNASHTGESFGLEYTLALRKEMLEAELEDIQRSSPAETVAESDDAELGKYEAEAMAWSIDRQDGTGTQKPAAGSARRISKLKMFGANSSFLQKT
ncbi:hypothetical protein FOZ62_006755, partial [Perkinsus olseni]